MNNSPIALFVYNRPWHTKQTVEALLKNELAVESDLIVFLDGAKSDDKGEKSEKGEEKKSSKNEHRTSNIEPPTSNPVNKIYEADDLRQTTYDRVKEVREYMRTIKGFKSIRIIEREKNLGLANSIISGVTEVVNEYNRIIVLEDDMVTSPYFLKYMNDALRIYENEEKVISVHGYVYPISGLPETFFLKGTDCWGWATWKRGWNLFEPDGQSLLNELKKKNLLKKFDFDGAYPYTKMLKDQISGRNDSWAIRWYASALLVDKLTLYPGKSLLNNIGTDASGTHKDDFSTHDAVIAEYPVSVKEIPPIESVSTYSKFREFHIMSRKSKSLFSKIKQFLERMTYD